MTPEQKLKALSLELPAPAQPMGAYIPAARAGELLFTAGQLPFVDGKLTVTGKVPTDVPLPAAQAAARQACINGLAAIRAECGSLDSVRRVVRMNVFVNSAPGFTDQAAIANGASELLLEVFGDPGRHTRCAYGVAELPLDSPLELDIVVQLRSED